MTQNGKNFCLLHLVSQESLLIVHMRKMNYVLMFFQFLIFGANSGVKGQNMSQNDRKLYVAPISQEAYTTWSRFLVQIYKMITSSYAFFIFSKFWFYRLLGGKRAKNGPRGQKNLSVSLYLRNRTSYDCGFWYKCVKW